MTELGKKILKYTLSETSIDKTHIYIPEIKLSIGNPPAELFNTAIEWAKDMGYLTYGFKNFFEPRGMYATITSAGREYLEKEEQAEKSQKEIESKELQRYTEEKRRSWIQFWIPLVLSNFISLLALFVAILAYLKQ